MLKIIKKDLALCLIDLFIVKACYVKLLDLTLRTQFPSNLQPGQQKLPHAFQGVIYTSHTTRKLPNWHDKIGIIKRHVKFVTVFDMEKINFAKYHNKI